MFTHNPRLIRALLICAVFFAPFPLPLTHTAEASEPYSYFQSIFPTPSNNSAYTCTGMGGLLTNSGNNVIVDDVLLVSPSNPNASVKARAWLEYLHDLPNRSGNRVLVGQQAGAGDETLIRWQANVESLHVQTGKWVSLVGFDVKRAGSNLDMTENDVSSMVKCAKTHGLEGGLIKLTMHLNNPFTGKSVRDKEGIDLVNLVTAGSPANIYFIRDLDLIANGLAELQQNDIVVMISPFHEMNGGWFWWSLGPGGRRATPEEFINLWKYTHNYFSEKKGLNNLLWVYGPSAGTSPTKDVMHYYPGSEWVDVVGVSHYGKSISYTLDTGIYQSMTATGKPFGFTEYGAPDRTHFGSDNMDLINGIRESVPKVVFTLNWGSWTNNSIAIVDHKNAKALLDDPWVITREEINLSRPEIDLKKK